MTFTFRLISLFLSSFVLLFHAQTTTIPTTTTTTQIPTTTATFICICDTSATAKTGETCLISFIGSVSDNNYILSGCSCTSGDPELAQSESGVFVQYCGELQGNYDNATTTTTTVATTTACKDANANGICDDVDEAAEVAAMRCTSRVLSKTWYNVFKILFCICFLYILICVAITVIINCKHKNRGHHRYIHLFQEIGIIFLFLTMMALQYFLNTKTGPCKIIKILIDFFMVWICAAFMFEAWFANSMINAASKKNGTIPAIINYIGSILIALISSLVPYFLKKIEYTPSGLHCFAPTIGNTLWAFIIPPWILITVACFKVQTAFLQCKKYDLKAVDRDQIYWAYRSARALPPFAWLLFGIYTTLMFGLDQQLYWVIILAIFMTFVYGPAIFFVHTYCHENTSKKWHPKFFGFYTPCPEEIRPPSPTPSDDISDSQPIPPDPQNPDQPPTEKPKKKKKKQPTDEKPKTPPPQGPIIPDRNHGGAQSFYDWLTDSKDTNKAQEESAMILFKPRP